MLNKFVNLIKEVFFIPKKTLKRIVKKKTTPAIKKKVVRKKTAPKPSIKISPITKVSKSKSAPKVVNKVITLKPEKAVKKKITAQVKNVPDPNQKEIGIVTHYFDRIKVVVVKLTYSGMLVGDKITFIGPKTKHVQKVWSMQAEHLDVKVAKKGQLIGLKVEKTVAVGDKVFK